MDDSTTEALTAGQEHAELNDMTPHEVYEAIRAGHFIVRGE